MVTKSIKASLIATALTIAVLGVSAKTVLADGCQNQYGGYTNCPPNDLVINKEVWQPISKSWVDNMGTADPVFTPGNEVRYKLTIKNNSGQTFNPVEVKDILPPYVSYVSGGPSGTSYDPATKTVIFKLENMIAGETRQFEIVAKVSDAKDFPAGRTTFCVVNTGQTKALDRFDEDTAQMCIRTDILGTTTLPKAGFQDILMFAPFATVGFAGLALLKKRG